jgi:hypothetical protein
MVLRWIRGFSGGDASEPDTVDNDTDLPWWEKVSHPDPQIRMEGRQEEQQEREANARYDRD